MNFPAPRFDLRPLSEGDLRRARSIRRALIRDAPWPTLAVATAVEMTMRNTFDLPRFIVGLDDPNTAHELSIYRALEFPPVRQLLDGPWATLAREHAARPAEHRAERISAPIPNEEIPMPANAIPDLPIDLNIASVALVLQVANLTDEDRAAHYRGRSLADLHGLHQEAYAARIFANRVADAVGLIERELGSELRKLAELADPQTSEGAKGVETRKMPTSWATVEELKRDIETWPELAPEGGLVIDCDDDAVVQSRLNDGRYAPYRLRPGAKTLLERAGIA